MNLKFGAEHITEEMYKNPEGYIPDGDYCYKSTGIQGINEDGLPYRKVENCPFWDVDIDMPYQENGYCHLLKQGDWDMNLDSLDTTIVDYCPDHPELVGKTYRELITMDDCPIPLFSTSLLWDQCKECGVNDDR